MQYTNNFKESEFTASSTADASGINNQIPNEEIRASLIALSVALLQPIRDVLREPVIITSGYRCPALNVMVGGVSSSQHTKGEAADCKTKDPIKLYKWLRDEACLVYDQIILYPTFVHISYKRVGTNRMETLYANGVSKV